MRPWRVIINLRQYSVEKFRSFQLSMIATNATPLCSMIKSCCVMRSITKMRLSIMSETGVWFGTYLLGRITNTLNPSRVSRPGQGKIVWVASCSLRAAALSSKCLLLTLQMSFKERSTSKLQKWAIRSIWTLVNFLRIASFPGIFPNLDWIKVRADLSFDERFIFDDRVLKDEKHSCVTGPKRIGSGPTCFSTSRCSWASDLDWSGNMNFTNLYLSAAWLRCRLVCRSNMKQPIFLICSSVSSFY